MDFKVITLDDEEFIVGYIEGHGINTVRSDHANYRMVKDLLDSSPEELQEMGPDNVAALFNPAEAISKRFEDLTERVSVRNGAIYFDGDPLNSALSDLIVKLMEDNEDFWPFVLFLENLMQNPQEDSRKMAFDWIQAAGDGMVITDTGFVVGFKGAEGRYAEGEDSYGGTDPIGYQSTTAGHAIVNGVEYNGKIPYAVGDEVTMPRSEVAFDPSSSCASGLHVGTRRYAGTYARDNGALMEVWVNPRDIVSVPRGEHEKMRVCRFFIAGTVEAEDSYSALRKEADVYVAPTVSPYDEDEFGDGEEFGDVDPQETEETPAFVGRTSRAPSQAEFADMLERAKRRHRGFVTYASTVGGWSLASGDGSEASHWTVTD